MRRQIMFLATNVIAVVLLTLCVNAPVYASHAGNNQGYHAVRPADPSPWSSQDIGSVGVPGSATSDGNTVTVTGSGTDIWYTADQFHYAYQSLQGDGALFVRVDSQTNSDAWAKAGIMIRSTLDPSSPYAYVMVSPGNGVAFQNRPTVSGASSHQFGALVQAPYWLELVRIGNIFTAYAASDGQSWTQVGDPQTIIMNSTAFIGLAVTSHNNTTSSTAVFSNVSPSPYSLTPPLTGISNLALNGATSASSSLPTFGSANGIDGSGVTYWENAPNDIHPWFQVDLGTAYPITEIKTQWLDTNVRTFRIDGSNDGKTWTTLSTVTSDTNANNDLVLNQAAVTRYLRLVIPQNTNLIYKLADFQALGGISVPPGPPGIQGIPGATGTQGIPGATGTPGVQGLRGPADPINLALNRPSASSTTRGLPNYASDKAVDGNYETRWSSADKNSQWLTVDLGASYAISEVKLYWGWRAYARDYQIWTSDNDMNWSLIYSTTNGHGQEEDLSGLSGSGRYVSLGIANLSCSIAQAIGKNAPDEVEVAKSCDIVSAAKTRPARSGKTGQPHSKSQQKVGKNSPPANPNANPEPNSQNYYSVREFEVYGNAVGVKGSVGDVGLQGPEGSQGPQGLTTPNLALSRPVTASSISLLPPLGNYLPSNAVDNTVNTWLSGANNATEWLTIDLGAMYTVREVKLFWAGAYYANGYQIQISSDNSTWTNLYKTTTGTGGIEDLTRMVGSGRYVRVNMTNHANATVGLSEVQVYGYPVSSPIVW